MNYKGIKKVREQKGMSQLQVVEKAKELGNSITQPQLSGWESGKIKPNNESIEILCSVLECNEDDFISVGTMSMTEFKKDAFAFGKNFDSNNLRNMYIELTAHCDIEDKVRILTDNIIELSSINQIAIPQSFIEVIRPSDDKERTVYQFIVSFWNGSVLRNKPKDKIDKKYL